MSQRARSKQHVVQQCAARDVRRRTRVSTGVEQQNGAVYFEAHPPNCRGIRSRSASVERDLARVWIARVVPDGRAAAEGKVCL